MVDNYSVKINRQEGSLEITGDKDWVSLKLNELKEIYAEHTPKSGKAKGSTGAKIVTKSKRSKSSTKRKTSSTRAQKNTDLDAKLSKEIKEKLENFIKERRTNFDHSLPSQAAIIARFLQKELDWPGVDQHDMYTTYTAMGWRLPGNPAAQLNNALSRNHYFSGVKDGKYILSHNGENYADHDSLQTSKTVKPSK